MSKVHHLPDDNNTLIVSTCKELTVWRPANNIYSALMPVVITDFKFHHYGVILVHWVETILLFNVHQGLGLANSCLQYKESHLVRSERQKRSTLSSASSSFLTPQITTWVSEPAVASLVGWSAWGGCEKGSYLVLLNKTWHNPSGDQTYLKVNGKDWVPVVVRDLRDDALHLARGFTAGNRSHFEL